MQTDYEHKIKKYTYKSENAPNEYVAKIYRDRLNTYKSLAQNGGKVQDGGMFETIKKWWEGEEDDPHTGKLKKIGKVLKETANKIDNLPIKEYAHLANDIGLNAAAEYGKKNPNSKLGKTAVGLHESINKIAVGHEQYKYVKGQIKNIHNLIEQEKKIATVPENVGLSETSSMMPPSDLAISSTT